MVVDFKNVFINLSRKMRSPTGRLKWNKNMLVIIYFMYMKYVGNVTTNNLGSMVFQNA